MVDAEPPVPPNLDTLPPELLRMILDYADLPLDDVYHLRFVCTAVGSVASQILFERINRVLLTQVDFHAFFRFMEVFMDIHQATAGPSSVGKLLKKAKVPIHSLAAFAVAQRLIETNEGAFNCAGAMYKAMDANPVDVRTVLHGFGYWKEDFARAWDQEPEDHDAFKAILDFTSEFHFENKVHAELLLSLRELSLRSRWTLVGRAFGWLDENGGIAPPGASDFDPYDAKAIVAYYWPKAISMARSEYGFDLDAMLNELKEVWEAIMWDDVWSWDAPSLLAPGVGLSPVEVALFVARLKATFNFRLRLLECYTNGPRLDFLPEPPAATNEQARLVFETLATGDDFPRYIADFIVEERWPSFVDPNHPDIRNLFQLDKDENIYSLCRALSEETVYRDYNKKFERFVAANGILARKHFWLKAIKDTFDNHPFAPEEIVDEETLLYQLKLILINSQ